LTRTASNPTWDCFLIQDGIERRIGGNTNSSSSESINVALPLCQITGLTPENYKIRLRAKSPSGDSRLAVGSIHYLPVAEDTTSTDNIRLIPATSSIFNYSGTWTDQPWNGLVQRRVHDDRDEVSINFQFEGVNSDFSL
jgi:hypothetical protein